MPTEDEINEAMQAKREDNFAADVDPDEGASADTHDKLQKRVADDERRRQGKK